MERSRQAVRVEITLTFLLPYIRSSFLFANLFWSRITTSRNAPRTTSCQYITCEAQQVLRSLKSPD